MPSVWQRSGAAISQFGRCNYAFFRTFHWPFRRKGLSLPRHIRDVRPTAYASRRCSVPSCLPSNTHDNNSLTTYKPYVREPTKRSMGPGPGQHRRAFRLLHDARRLRAVPASQLRLCHRNGQHHLLHLPHARLFPARHRRHRCRPLGLRTHGHDGHHHHVRGLSVARLPTGRRHPRHPGHGSGTAAREPRHGAVQGQPSGHGGTPLRRAALCRPPRCRLLTLLHGHQHRSHVCPHGGHRHHELGAELAGHQRGRLVPLRLRRSLRVAHREHSNLLHLPGMVQPRP